MERLLFQNPFFFATRVIEPDCADFRKTADLLNFLCIEAAYTPSPSSDAFKQTATNLDCIASVCRTRLQRTVRLSAPHEDIVVAHLSDTHVDKCKSMFTTMMFVAAMHDFIVVGTERTAREMIECNNETFHHPDMMSCMLLDYLAKAGSYIYAHNCADRVQAFVDLAGIDVNHPSCNLVLISHGYRHPGRAWDHAFRTMSYGFFHIYYTLLRRDATADSRLLYDTYTNPRLYVPTMCFKHLACKIKDLNLNFDTAAALKVLLQENGPVWQVVRDSKLVEFAELVSSRGLGFSSEITQATRQHLLNACVPSVPYGGDHDHDSTFQWYYANIITFIVLDCLFWRCELSTWNRLEILAALNVGWKMRAKVVRTIRPRNYEAWKRGLLEMYAAKSLQRSQVAALMLSWSEDCSIRFRR